MQNKHNVGWERTEYPKSEFVIITNERNSQLVWMDCGQQMWNNRIHWIRVLVLISLARPTYPVGRNASKW